MNPGNRLCISLISGCVDRQVIMLGVRSVCGTWGGALHLNLPAAAQAYAAVGLRVGEQPLADVVNLFIQLIWNVGGLEYGKGNVCNQLTAN